MKTANRNEHAPSHELVWSLLPWFVNGSLADDEDRSVREHLGACLTCHRELRRLQALERAVAVPAGEYASARGYARLTQRMRSGRVVARTGFTARAARAFGALFEPLPLISGAALLVISALIVATIVVNGDRAVIRAEQPFLTLAVQPDSNGTVRSPLVRVVLHEEPLPVRLDAWLSRHGAELVDGPSEIGVMTVRVDIVRRSFGDVISGMRADTETAFVEPVSYIGVRPDRAR